MAAVSDTIPAPLEAEVGAALAWFNAQQSTQFEVTGIVDAERSLQEEGGKELRLVLCGGDLCQRQNFHFSPGDAGFDVRLIDEDLPAGSAQPELDPPPGARRHWLDTVLQHHSFTLLLFYRGFW